MITFLDLPPEIMDLIASHLLHLDVAQLNILNPAPDPDPEGEEHPLTVTISADDGAGTIVSIVSFSSDGSLELAPARHINDIATTSSTSGPLPPYSSISNLSSTCQQVRSNLFTSRECRSVIVQYDGISHERADRISAFLMASVKKLRLVSRSDSDPILKSNKRLPGIGDILSPYQALQHLEIDWNLLPADEARIQAMEAAALALPAMKYDLRYSRACVLALLDTLHIRLSSPKNIFIDSIKADIMAQQFNLILQQFDMPVLRHLEISQKFSGMLDMVKRQWVQLLKNVPAQDWPNLESVRIGVDVPYRYYMDSEREAEIAIWQPLAKAIINHFSRTKKAPPRITIVLNFSFCTHLTPDPFTSTSASDTTTTVSATDSTHYIPREQIAPSRETMQAFINDQLQGPAQAVPFTVEVHGTCLSENTVYQPLVRATYTPLNGAESVANSTAAAAAAAVGGENATTTRMGRLDFELYQQNIDLTHAATVRPRAEGEAAPSPPIMRLRVRTVIGREERGDRGDREDRDARDERDRMVQARMDTLRRRRGDGRAMVFGAGGVFMM